jgi:hypothetical protein
MSATKTVKESKPDKFKRGDLVRVVTPLAFVRCGYPLDPGEVNDKMRREHMRRVRDFLNLDGLPDLDPAGFLDDSWMDARAVNLAVRALASQHLAKHGFGGRERTIHTVEMPDIKGKVFKVTGWQFNKTGDYYPPSHYGGGWDGPAEYEPGGLTNVETHKVLHLQATDGTFKTLKIEARHVEKVTD